jgi:putative aldouronate transport system substrate-binding protein
MKRFWIAAVILATAAMVVAVCLLLRAPDEAVAQEGSVPTLQILTIGESDENATRRVSQALSQITQERLGCSVEITMIPPSGYDDLIGGLVLSNDLADILLCTQRGELETLVNNNYVYSLDRYLDRYPEFKERVPDGAAWLETTVDGHCYGIPLGNDDAFASGFLMRSDICQELGIRAEEITDLQQLEQVLLRVQESYPDLMPVVSHYGHMENFICYDIQANGAVGAVGDGYYQSIAGLDGFSQLCETMYDWHERQLILRNATLSDDSREAWIGNGLAFGSFARLNAYTRRQTEYTLGADLECIYLSGLWDVWDGSANCFCVYAYTQDVELSLSLLRLIYTDPQVRQLCMYGQEGVDYQLTAKGVAVPSDTEPEGGRYISWNWPLLDELSPPWRSSDDFSDLQTDAEPRTFWLLDQQEISVEVYQCEKVREKYFDALCAGMLEPEEGIAQMRQELEEAGIETVVNEANRQWRATQNKSD